MRIFKFIALVAVSSFLFACGDDGGFFVPVSNGNKTFTASGGSGDAAVAGSVGGSAGGIFMDVYGDVKVKKTGTVDTGFSIPSYDYHFGANKATVSVDTTVKLQGTDTIVAGDLFLIPMDTNLYVSNGETGTVVTGLEVMSGATLTVPANSDTWAYIQFDQSVLIDGTVKTAADGVDLDIETESFFQIGSKGLVTTKSASAAIASGDIYLYSWGVFINKGVIDASGADTSAAETNGGNAGYVEADADSFLYNTGAMLSMGGDAADGSGGAGYGVWQYSYYASVHTSGNLDCSGGDGGNGSGGGTAGIFIYAGTGEGDNIGHLLVGGTLTANGGSGTNGNGGSAGSIYLDNNGGKLWTSAAVTAKGGASDLFSGGQGGYYRIFADYGAFEGQFTVETWGIKITGNIDLSGGSGRLSGGFGGRLEVRNNIAGAGLPTLPAVEMVGYKSLTMNGGSAFNGGFGGFYQILTHDWYSNSGVALPVGSISNSVPASMVGGSGDAIAGNGGFGGMFYQVTYNYYGHDGVVVAENSAALDVSGGDGYSAYPAGFVLLYGYNKATNSGAITSLGGDGVYGGPGAIMGGIMLLSSYDVLNTGAMTGSGGFGDLEGGFGGFVGMYAGNQVKNKASITVNGGDSESVGGNGGQIFLGSELVPTSNAGALKVFGGNGGTSDGAIGVIEIDGVDVTPI